MINQLILSSSLNRKFVTLKAGGHTLLIAMTPTITQNNFLILTASFTIQIKTGRLKITTKVAFKTTASV
jgi:hypothetical protein